MRWRKLLLIALALIAGISFSASAQQREFYYYYRGQKIPLTPANDRLVVKFKTGGES